MLTQDFTATRRPGVFGLAAGGFECRTQGYLFTQLHWRKRMAQIYSPDEASPVDLSSLRVKRWGILKLL
jgi:hypothetical protein